MTLVSGDAPALCPSDQRQFRDRRYGSMTGGNAELRILPLGIGQLQFLDGVAAPRKAIEVEDQLHAPATLSATGICARKPPRAPDEASARQPSVTPATHSTQLAVLWRIQISSCARHGGIFEKARFSVELASLAVSMEFTAIGSDICTQEKSPPLLASSSGSGPADSQLKSRDYRRHRNLW